MSNTNKYFDRGNNEVTEVELLKNRNANEQLAIKYFQKIRIGGCFTAKYVSDKQHEKMIEDLIGDREQRRLIALKRLGLDEEQVQEIPPVSFEGYSRISDQVRGLKKDYVAFTDENKVVTPTKELTWIFFGDDQIFVYKCRVDTVDNALRSEETQEYFYKDITAFANQSESYTDKIPVLKQGCASSRIELEERVVEAERFRIVVPGEIFSCAISVEQDNSQKISAMKQKLREKKNA
jgi:hypothetical protein